jgi:hypothetical protein
MAYVTCCITACGRRSLTVKTDVLRVELRWRVLVISWRKKCARPHSGERGRHPHTNRRQAPCRPVMLVTEDPAQTSPLGFLV